MTPPAVALLAGLLALAGCADGAPRRAFEPTAIASLPVELAASLTAELESKASAAAQILFDPGARRLSWSLAYADLSGPPTAAHFHGPADANAGAPVTINLAQGGPAGNPLRGQARLTETQAEQLLAGRWYLDIHTPAHPAGEIRGRVLPRS